MVSCKKGCPLERLRRLTATLPPSVLVLGLKSRREISAFGLVPMWACKHTDMEAKQWVERRPAGKEVVWEGKACGLLEPTLRRLAYLNGV